VGSAYLGLGRDGRCRTGGKGRGQKVVINEKKLVVPNNKYHFFLFYKFFSCFGCGPTNYGFLAGTNLRGKKFLARNMLFVCFLGWNF